ncbi:potassium channel family protein [Streptomyces sp. DSM 42041]|uniref:Potassium channel family protein n=1 Tax=Streptomyces hazeniae TaxID=3075538 RepID=A0ABU2NRK7_9ACTN|nr:potassium channel family protein [Streptomyces sp. DSM 42041]MDT0379619.1 potassium channel family protein [Streptomyces sp. DSM 42041]
MVTALMVTGYFLLPLDAFGSERPVIGWSVFVLLLTLIAVLLLKQMRDVLLDRRGVHPGFVIPLLVALTVLAFSAAYYTLAKEPGQFHGLRTRLDALYFTVVTLATVGYGDIHPRGQTSRLLAVIQITYNLVFLTAAATTLSHRFRRHVGRHWGGRGGGAVRPADREGPDDGRPDAGGPGDAGPDGEDDGDPPRRLQ